MSSEKKTDISSRTRKQDHDDLLPGTSKNLRGIQKGVELNYPSVIVIGNHEINTWYYSPYPQEYAKLHKFFMCDFCLKYTKTNFALNRHQIKCKWKHPSANEIYKCGNTFIYEMDGNVDTIFCRNLCLLGKLFLDLKVIFSEVEPFLFYVLKVNNSTGSHIIGYFSKAKIWNNYNLSCVMILPPYQKQGYGRFLIEFKINKVSANITPDHNTIIHRRLATILQRKKYKFYVKSPLRHDEDINKHGYLLSRIEGKSGTPETPLSVLGRQTYIGYWKSVLLEYFNNKKLEMNFNVDKLSKDTGMIKKDIKTTLHELGFINSNPCSKYEICIDWEKVDAHMQKVSQSKRIKVDPDNLRWTPWTNTSTGSTSKTAESSIEEKT